MNTSILKKIYPDAVRMRPILWVIGVIVILGLIISLIIITASTFFQHNTPALEKPISKFASAADTNWYQDLKIRKPQLTSTNIEATQKATEIVVKNSAVNPAVHHDAFVNSTSTSTQEPKPYSAPITSNQLSGEQFYGRNVTGDLSANKENNHPLQSSNDPAPQAQKIDFLKNAAQLNQDDYLSSTLKNPLSLYELQAGTVIPAILMTGINSDLPGQITAQVKSPVYDTISGRHVLIPQGARLIGLYDSQVVYGQERVLVAWKRLMMPNGKSIDLEGMPGVDLSGYAGLNDQVNHHYGKIFGSVILMSILSAGAQLSQPQQSADNNQSPTVNQMIAQSLGTNIANAGTLLLTRGTNIPPTLQIRPGYEMNISVTKDMVFPGPYVEGI